LNRSQSWLAVVVIVLCLGTACNRTSNTQTAVSKNDTVPAPPPSASVTCNPPNGPQNGDVPFDRVKVRCDSPPPCGGVGTALGVIIESTFGSRILATLQITKFNEQAQRIDSRPQSFEVPAGGFTSPGTSAIVGCSGQLDLRDIQNPRTYAFSYQLVEAKKISDQQTGGSYTCPQVTAKITQCGARPVLDGTFEPQSAAFLLAEYNGNDRVWVVPQNSPICIDRHAPSYDNFRQEQCRGNDADSFRIANPDTAGCYMMVDIAGLLIHPDVRDSDASKLNGSKVEDMYTHGCASEIDSVHWQLVPVPQKPDYYLIKNKLTGGCIEALTTDNNQNRVGNEVSVQQCSASKLQQQWKLKRMP
jgi:hypothetical protein